MVVQTVKLNSISQEKTLRQDFDYHYYHNRFDTNYYKFEELFEIVDHKDVSIDGLYQPFQYCEIGNADKNGDIVPVALDFSERNLLDENYYKKIEKGDIISVSENDILIAKVRPNLKKYIRITNDIVGVYFTSAFIQIRSKFMPEIMYYCFRNLFYNDLMAISRQGKGYPTLSETDLLNLRFDKSMIDCLHKNSTLISKLVLDIEADVAKLKGQIRTQQEIIDSTFEHRFGFNYKKFSDKKTIHCFDSQQMSFSNNPDLRFSTKFHRLAGNFVLDELTSITDKKIKHFLSDPILLGASISPEDYSDNGEYCYISMATIKNWSFDSENARTVSKEYSDSKQEKTIQKNDIILARSGEGTIGKVALIDSEDTQGVFADFTMRIRLKDYNPEFAYYYFRTSYFQYLIEIYKKGLGNNTNIFPIVVQEFPMIDIPLEEQQRIVDKIHLEITKHEEIKAEISRLREKVGQIIDRAIARGADDNE